MGKVYAMFITGLVIAILTSCCVNVVGLCEPTTEVRCDTTITCDSVLSYLPGGAHWDRDSGRIVYPGATWWVECDTIISLEDTK